MRSIPLFLFAVSIGAAAGCALDDSTSVGSAPLEPTTTEISAPAPSGSTAASPPEPTPGAPTTTEAVELPPTIEVVEVLRRVEYYGACGNETLESEDMTWYPLLPDENAVLDETLYPVPPAVDGLLRVGPPGPGDDIGDMVVYSDGIARFESDSGWVIWLTDELRTYGWEC